MTGGNGAFDWARRQVCGGPTEKCVLFTLAVLADDNGVCVTSRARLSEMTEQSRRAVERALETLEGRKLIARGSKAETTEISLLMGGEVAK